MSLKLSQKTKTQLRAGVVLTAFGMATWAVANLPLEMPKEAPAQTTTTVTAKPMQPR